MATQVQFRGGTTTEHSSFTGVAKEVTVDTTKKTLVVHDGATVGGVPLATEAAVNGKVGLTGNETVAGTKTFSSTISGSITGNAGTVTNGVYTSGDQTIGGVKTLSSNPIVNAGTANGVAFLNGSKVLTTGSALTFDGAIFSATAGGSALSASGGTVARFINSGASRVDVVGGNTGFSILEFSRANLTAAGQVVYEHSGNSMYFTVNGGSEQMRLTSTGLGIGTSSIPTVGGTTVLAVGNSSGGTLGIVQSGSITYRISASTSGVDCFNPNSSPISWYTAGVARMTLDASGNLGLGVTPSAWGTVTALQVKNAAFIGFGETAYVSGNAYFNGGWKYIASSGAGRYDVDGGSGGIHRWFTAPSGTAGNAISFTQAMTLDASGNLGIGTTSLVAGARLTLKGASGVAGFIEVANANNTPGVTGVVMGQNTDNGAYFWNRANEFLSLGTNNTERARIDSSGNLLVGTTSRLFSLTATLQVAQGSNGQAGIFQTTGAGTAITFQNSTAGGVGSITTTGSTTLYNVTSDYRLKTVIGPVANAGQRIDALQPVEYTWNASGERTRGFLAHQFQEVYAGSVTGTKDAVDAEGKPVYQSMQASSSEVIADLVAELQSLRARITALESN